jgi:NAD(P)-dependent dehydrogenase (short-subunit alcohol dehydrogenase family)
MNLGQNTNISSTNRAEDAVSRSRVAIVTGASSGIGLGLVKRLLTAGYRVVANSRNITASMTLCESSVLKLVDGDIGTQQIAKNVVESAILNFGRIDLLINNAGVFIPKPFTEYTDEDFRRASETNLLGFFYVTQLAVSQMRLQQSGHVVNITSSIVDQPVAGCTASLVNLTKGGLQSVARALAIELAHDGVRFNAISPGVVDIPMHQVEAHEFLKQLSPLGRLAEVAEIVDSVLFLESAPFVNGEVIHVDGGAHAGKW